MKKVIKVLLIVITVFSLNSYAEAEDISFGSTSMYGKGAPNDINGKTIDVPILCYYSGQGYQIAIASLETLSYNSNKYAVFAHSSFSLGGKFYLGKDQGTLVYETGKNGIPDNSTVTFQKINSQNVLKGICPKNAYLDTENKNEVCFDDDGSSCQDKNSNGNFLGYGKKNFDKKLSLTKTLLEEFESKVVNGMYNIIDLWKCSDLISYKGTESGDDVSKILEDLNGFYSKFGETPKSVLSSQQYTDFSVNYKKKRTDKMNFCNQKNKDDKNQGIISEEEYEKNKEALEYINEKFEQSEKDFLNPEHIFGELGECGVLEGITDLLNKYYIIIEIFMILGLVVLSMLEFTKALISNEADSIKKAWKHTITRIIILFIIILLPVLINWFLPMFGFEGKTCIK